MNNQFLRVDSFQADSMTRLKMTDRNMHVPVGRDKDSCSLSQKDIIVPQCKQLLLTAGKKSEPNIYITYVTDFMTGRVA